MVALAVSTLITILLTLAIIPVAKRRPIGTPLTWGEAMFAAMYVFGLLLLAWGIVPHEWLTLADKDWQWRPDRLVFGPGDILKPKANGGRLPFTIHYQVLRDVIAAGIYGVTLGAWVGIWIWWQKRGKKVSTEVEVSSYGRPLARNS
jgi:hypothetical protein